MKKKLKSDSPLRAATCSRIVGYRLEDGTDKAELYFLPGRPAQKTLNQMAELIKSGWMVTGIIYSENANVDLPDTAAQDSASKSNNPAVSG